MGDEKLAMDFWGRVEQAQQLYGKASLKDICRKIGVPYQTIANQKTGARLPSLIVAVALAKELGTNVEWLLYGADKVSKALETSKLNVLMIRIEGLTQTELIALEVLLGVNHKHSETL